MPVLSKAQSEYACGKSIVGLVSFLVSCLMMEREIIVDETGHGSSIRTMAWKISMLFVMYAISADVAAMILCSEVRYNNGVAMLFVVKKRQKRLRT